MMGAAMFPNMRELIALLYTLGYFGFLVLVMFKDLPVDGEETMKLLLAIMSTAQIAIIQYYFGSSQKEVPHAPVAPLVPPPAV